MVELVRLEGNGVTHSQVLGSFVRSYAMFGWFVGI
jgi:hypothetical protein